MCVIFQKLSLLTLGMRIRAAGEGEDGEEEQHLCYTFPARSWVCISHFPKRPLAFASFVGLN